MVWQTDCLIRLSVSSRGRAVPLGWSVRQHGRAPVAFEAYQARLDRAALRRPRGGKVILLADRGLAETALMAHLDRRGWHWRLRITSRFWLSRRGHRRGKVARLAVAQGPASFWHHVRITAQRYGPVHLGVARPRHGQDVGYGLRDEPTEAKPCAAYGLRLAIEENFWDDTSKGFPWEASLMRAAQALTRLWFVLAVTPRALVAQGTEVVKQGKRRWVDPHWLRGQRYGKIGWHWVHMALRKGLDLRTTVHVSSDCDPEPAMASPRP